ncbi:hypothetical protein H6785_03560 [Candidatus Nomurabacteria bacterium]|nr:hypothetical protein [Candidatus Kaiserbacteria bacterium]MCB9815624.1 hypothetical protein [Candidatus Nomurabacteria bacterium]
MQSKSLLIAIAAFAVTTTGVQAYGGVEKLARAGINKEQIQAFEEARELRESGDLKSARDRLVKAGIDEETLKKVREAKKMVHSAIQEAVENKDYETFKVAIADSPLSDIVTTKSDFDLFVEAHELKMEGEWIEAEEIFSELGINRHGKPRNHFGMRGHVLSDLDDVQREAFQVARQSNDRETMHAILKEAGVELHHRHREQKPIKWIE